MSREGGDAQTDDLTHEVSESRSAHPSPHKLTDTAEHQCVCGGGCACVYVRVSVVVCECVWLGVRVCACVHECVCVYGH